MKKESLNKNTSKVLEAILNIFFILLAIFCLIIIFKEKEFSIIPIEFGILLLIVLFNIARKVKINDTNTKILSLISIVANIISIILSVVLGRYIIFSYALSLPSLIVSIKNIKHKKNTLNIISLILSIVMLVICVTISAIGFIKAS